MQITQAALNGLDALHEAEPTTADRVEDLLDLLEVDPQDPRVRLRRFRGEVGVLANTVWFFAVRGASEDIGVFWHVEDGTVCVDRIGPWPPRVAT